MKFLFWLECLYSFQKLNKSQHFKPVRFHKEIIFLASLENYEKLIMIIPHSYLEVLKVGAVDVGLPNCSLFREKLESAFLTVYYCAVGGVYDKKVFQPFVPIWMWSGCFPVQTSQVVLVVKKPPASAGDVRNAGSVPGSGRSPWGGHGHSLQYSRLENRMDRGAWWAVVHGVTKSWTWLKWLSTHFFFTWCVGVAQLVSGFLSERIAP